MKLGAVGILIQIWLLWPGSVCCVKIGVSKTSTTTTTTIAPNDTVVVTEDYTTLPTLISTTTALEPEILTTEGGEFPPKITKSVPKITTSKPSVTRDTTSKISTTPTPPTTFSELDNNSTASFLHDNTTASSVHFYCACNLLPSLCDINCCCDQDCAKDILKVFNCFAHSKYPELRLRLEEFQYEHGLPSCKINDGWFCVFRTNTRPPIPKVYNFDYDTTHNYKWPSALIQLDETEQVQERDFYKFGEPLKLVNMETLEVQSFELPFAYKPPFCQLNEPIYHLKSMERTCLVTSLAAAQETKRKFQILATTAKFLSHPQKRIEDLDAIKEHTQNIILRSCSLKIETNDYNCNELDGYNTTENNDETSNYFVAEVRISIIHNYTDIMAAIVELVEQEFEANETVFELWQKYNVEFVANGTMKMEKRWKTNWPSNDETDATPSYSGPLGYLQDEPVIVATYVANNDSEDMTAQNRMLDYFRRPHLRNNTLNLPMQRNGFCFKKYNKVHSINYGISTLNQCTLRVSNENLGALTTKRQRNDNGTDICRRLQAQVHAMLFDINNHQLDELKELHVSTLGHPQNDSDKWVPLQVLNMEFAPIVGQFISNTQTLLCHNILLSAAFEFHIGIFPEQGIAHQALLKHAILKLGQRHDLEFSLDERLEVPLTTTVMFYDLFANGGGSFSKASICLIFCLFLSNQWVFE